jgi:hypothetical protein
MRAPPASTALAGFTAVTGARALRLLRPRARRERSRQPFFRNQIPRHEKRTCCAAAAPPRPAWRGTQPSSHSSRARKRNEVVYGAVRPAEKLTGGAKTESVAERAQAPTLLSSLVRCMHAATLDALCAALAAEGVCLADEGCVVEVFRRSRPEPRASARTERAAYDAARRQALCGGVGAEQRDAAVERALFQSLPAAVQGALGADAPLWLFNEQHVVKPARSTCTFAWHRDAEEQLALCTDLGLQQGSSTPYVSVWLPLDDCSARNGTLVVLPRFEVRFSCMHCVADKSDVRAVPCSRGSLSKQQTLGASRWTCRPVEHAHSRATYGTPAAATAATRHGASSTRSTARRRS